MKFQVTNKVVKLGFRVPSIPRLGDVFLGPASGAEYAVIQESSGRFDMLRLSNFSCILTHPSLASLGAALKNDGWRFERPAADKPLPKVEKPQDEIKRGSIVYVASADFYYVVACVGSSSWALVNLDTGSYLNGPHNSLPDLLSYNAGRMALVKDANMTGTVTTYED